MLLIEDTDYERDREYRKIDSLPREPKLSEEFRHKAISINLRVKMLDRTGVADIRDLVFLAIWGERQG